MRKYVKPELFYEHYELSQHIADCAWELTSSEGSCSAAADSDYIQGLDNLFTDSIGGCVLIPGKNYEDICYHDGGQGANVFMS